VIPIPPQASALDAGNPKALLVASDNQEAKNVNTIGPNALPNTTIKTTSLTVVDGPAITWLTPLAGACAVKKERLIVLASDTARISGVTFYDGARKLAKVTNGVADLYATTWKTGGLARGRHVLRAVVADTAGQHLTASRSLRVC
jgi:hypothetical protein